MHEFSDRPICAINGVVCSERLNRTVKLAISSTLVHGTSDLRLPNIQLPNDLTVSLLVSGRPVTIDFAPRRIIIAVLNSQKVNHAIRVACRS